MRTMHWIVLAGIALTVIAAAPTEALPANHCPQGWVGYLTDTPIGDVGTCCRIARPYSQCYTARLGDGLAQ